MNVSTGDWWKKHDWENLKYLEGRKIKNKRGGGGGAQTTFVHYKSHRDWPGTKQQPQQNTFFHVTSTFIFTDYEICYLLNL
jgi:hypothetical protein